MTFIGDSFSDIVQKNSLLPQLHHHIRDLDVLLGLILGSNLENHVLLMLRNRLLADVLYQLAHSVHCLLAKALL